MEELIINSEKEPIIPVEHSLMLQWAPYLESIQRGTILVYLQLQVAAAEKGSESRAKITIEELCKRSAITYPTLRPILKLLTEEKFISINSKGRAATNEYTILRLPVFKNINLEEMEIKTEPKPVEDSPGVFNVGIERFMEAKIDMAKDLLEQLEIKELEKWNARDMITYYKNKYLIDKKVPTKEFFSVKDTTLTKQVMQQYGPERTKAMINHAIKDWESYKFSKDFPLSIISIHTFRETLAADIESQFKIHRTKDVGEW